MKRRQRYRLFYYLNPKYRTEEGTDKVRDALVDASNSDTYIVFLNKFHPKNDMTTGAYGNSAEVIQRSMMEINNIYINTHPVLSRIKRKERN